MKLVVRDGREGVPDEFLELPHRIYRDDPRWIPEEPHAVTRSFSADNPWFEGRDAIVVCAPGACRAAAFWDPAARMRNEPFVFFGYWESTGDPTANAEVMAHIEAWAIQRGASRLYGPVNFTTFGTYRLRVDAGDDGDPFPGEPYNPVSYPRYLAALGFSPSEMYVSQLGLPGAVEAKGAIRDRVLEQGYRLEILSHDLWLESLPEIHGSVDSIFGANPGYSAPSFALFERICGRAFIRAYCPHASVIAYDPDGLIAGFLLVIPHYGPISVQRAGAQRVAASQLSFDGHYPILAARGPVTGLAKTGGVMPAHRRSGIMDAMVVQGAERGGPLYANWIGALIRADNASRRLGGGGHAGERLYALYAKSLSAGTPPEASV